MSEETIKAILKRVPYGFYSLTSRSGDEVNAMVMNWFTQVSFEPRLVAIGLQRTSYTYGLVKEGRVFAVNLFLQGDLDLIDPLTKGREKRPDKMEQVSYSPAGETGCPVIEGAAGYIECEVVEIIETGGDHDIVLGRVIGGEVLKAGEVEDTLNLPEVGWSYAG